jgi:uncharacterized membrane protein YeiB
MDDLSSLPPTKNDISPQDANIMSRYFDAPGAGAGPGTSWGATFKAAGLVSILFLLLTNPLTDAMLSAIPYAGANALSMLAVKTIIFAVLFIVMYKYML